MSTLALWLVLGATLCAAAPRPHDRVRILPARGLLIVQNDLSLRHDEGMEDTEEGLEDYKDYQEPSIADYRHEAEGYDGRYIQDPINYDVDESVRVTRYEDYQELTTSPSKQDSHSGSSQGWEEVETAADTVAPETATQSTSI